jgi:hypothetical protein
MDKLFRLKAGIYATLANTGKLADLPRSQKEKLVEDVRAAGLLSSPLNVLKKGRSHQRVVKYDDPRLIASWGNPYVPNEWLPIVNAHRWAHLLINAVLNSGRVEAVTLADFYKRLPQPVAWILKQGVIEDSYDVIEQSEYDLLRGLDEIRKLKPFPFLRCKLCHTVFVRFGKRRYCSKRCTDRAVGSRNEYMRKYMADRRDAQERIKRLEHKKGEDQ